MHINLSEQSSLLSQFVYELRHMQIQKDRLRFRKNLERIGEILAYEISKRIGFEDVKVETVLGVAKGQTLSAQPVIATILRAGLPIHQGVLNYFDHADCSYISAYRKHDAKGGFHIELEYCSCPSLEGRTLIVSDPMLATGSSLCLTLQELQKFGKPKQVHVVCAIASKPGVEKVSQEFPDAYIWSAACDAELDSRSYIVPGLGDAGDLAYGEKLQR